MPTFSPDALGAAIDLHLPRSASQLCVAYSGGLDSTVLLSALSRLRQAGKAFELRAVHIDHQLHARSGAWAEHCRRTSQRLAIPFTSVCVEVSLAGEGLEAAARKARYAALRALLARDEVLLTAHHADDQLETILLALMRGAGPKGLSGMPAAQRFAGGWLARPLLAFRRCDLEAWAQAEHLDWISDPSNDNASMDRNYLRHRIAPALNERWPAAASSAVRSGEHLAETAHLLEVLAGADLQAVSVGKCLDVERLRELDGARRRNLLRFWLKSCGVRAPSARKLAAIDHDMLAAERDRLPSVRLDQMQLRRHRGLLYCVPLLPELSPVPIEWSMTTSLELPAGLGRLHMQSARGAGIAAARLPALVQVRFRLGGERLQAAGDRHHRPLKKLLQDSRVLPWWRARLPLLHAGRELVAVGDLWVNAAFAAGPDEGGLRIVWEGKPEITAQDARIA